VEPVGNDIVRRSRPDSRSAMVRSDSVLAFFSTTSSVLLLRGEGGMIVTLGWLTESGVLLRVLLLRTMAGSVYAKLRDRSLGAGDGVLRREPSRGELEPGEDLTNLVRKLGDIMSIVR
jgi:hypothetical protein